jgi:hypothetical protein
VHTYRAVETDAGDWTVEWMASGVVLGHVFGKFDDKALALLGAFEMSRWYHLHTLTSVPVRAAQRLAEPLPASRKGLGVFQPKRTGIPPRGISSPDGS